MTSELFFVRLVSSVCYFISLFFFIFFFFLYPGGKGYIPTFDKKLSFCSVSRLYIQSFPESSDSLLGIGSTE